MTATTAGGRGMRATLRGRKGAKRRAVGWEMAALVAAFGAAGAFIAVAWAVQRFLRTAEAELRSAVRELEALSRTAQATLEEVRRSVDRLAEDVHGLAMRAEGPLVQSERLAKELTDRAREIGGATASLRTAGERMLTASSWLLQKAAPRAGQVAEALALARAGVELMRRIRARRATGERSQGRG
ncbi:hypothetical protein [Hydrogenibacillus schlegelii]|uniref:hypothetical protein n=1 Tax=Hydrogenibacillus schlegelii TaxID=1484 RepID=UPI00235575B7|nr:hypothetical protein [Hydrogenibacillus schlegelii]